ncbi:uncharacterized protein [Oscarella lobularis]
MLGDGARSHFVFTTQILPKIADTKNATFTYVTGRLGEGMRMPNVGLMCIDYTCIYGLIMVAQEEMKEKPIRINEFRLGLYVTREKQELADECGMVLAGLATTKGLAVKEKLVRIAKEEDLATWHQKLH